MIHDFTRLRRFAVGLLSLGIALPLFHRQLAESLVIRGDDLLYRGQRTAAMQHYDRARFLDPSLAIAADHLFFALAQRHDPQSLRRATDVVTDALERDPDNATLLADRALCEVIARRFEQARRDFARAASAGHDAQDLLFSRWAGRHVRAPGRGES